MVWWASVMEKVKERVGTKMEVELCWREVVKC